METESVWARAVKAKSQVQPKTEVEVEPEPLFRKSPEQEARIVLLSREPVELYKILKFEGLTGSGGDARKLVADGHVLLNGKVETQKRKKVVSGDVIEFNGETLLMQLENNNGQ
ncbi:MAG: RNA-binding S4 domain-containing protein [Gammaproteobacteria bacterium]|nr:RNA-binding S4 domain-containing protein [Gammaproteobacteria bacterium]